MENDIRKKVGIILRFPIIVFIAFYFYLYIWPLIVLVAIVFIILHPCFYPIIWLWHAFIGSDKDIYSEYFSSYPDKYIKWIKIGYKSLTEWLINGWN